MILLVVLGPNCDSLKSNVRPFIWRVFMTRLHSAWKASRRWLHLLHADQVKGPIDEEWFVCAGCAHRVLGCQQGKLQEPIWGCVHRNLLCLPYRLQSTRKAMDDGL